jgi:predicted RNA methylase
LHGFQKAKQNLEQYPTDAVATADLLFHIVFEQRDIESNIVVDLGCGPGNLGIAAALLSQCHVIAVDMDPDTLQILQENLKELEIQDRFTILNADLRDNDTTTKILQVLSKFQNSGKIVCISNPPFGVHQKGIDVRFLEVALSFADILYSVHLAGPKNEQFLEQKISQMGGIITHRSRLNLMVKESLAHHRRHIKPVETIVYRIMRNREFKKN